MKYKIEVHSLGYTDHIKEVDAPSLRVAKQSERQAKVDLDGDFELPFTRTTKV